MKTLYRLLPQRFYDREPVEVAKDLLGKLLVRKIGTDFRIGRIVETEAYLPFGDSASHSFRGKTNRNKSMFKAAGHAYIYRMHQYCLLNVVTEGEDIPGGVLIRAVEPIAGFEEITPGMTNGPGKLCRAFSITHELDGIPLTTKRSSIWITEDPYAPLITTVTTTRIGVTSAKDELLRFYIEKNPHVSRIKKMSIEKGSR